MPRVRAETIFVDTNIFIRHFTGDPPDQARLASQLLAEAVEGKTQLVTSDLVIAELVWTLESFYKFSRREIRSRIEAILNTRNLRVLNAAIVAKAIAEYAEKNVDFVDAHIYATLLARKYRKVATFNRKHFKRFPGVEIVVGESQLPPTGTGSS